MTYLSHTNKKSIQSQIRELLPEIIRKIDGKYVVYPKSGGKRLGTHSTKKAAKNQLTAIHLNKEAKEKRDRCLKIADRKYDKPSAYKSGAVVRCRKGDIWKGIKEAIGELEEAEKESLHKWFSRKGSPGKKGGWVDCNSPIRKDGKITGYKPCGREKGEKRNKYPSCRPTPGRCKDPGKGKSWGKTK